MTYVFKNLAALRDHLRGIAEHEYRTEDAQTTAKSKAYHRATADAYLHCAEIVRDSIVEDVALYDEYSIAYGEALEKAGIGIWFCMNHLNPAAMDFADPAWWNNIRDGSRLNVYSDCLLVGRPSR